MNCSRHSIRPSLRSRRRFLKNLAIGTAIPWTGPNRSPAAVPLRPGLSAGEGRTDITPPLGIDLGGFHKTPGNERRVTGIRRTPFVRALVLDKEPTQVALVSMDIINISMSFSGTIRKAVEEKTGIPASNVHICTTHTHSMPSLRGSLQWGSFSPEYADQVKRKTVVAVIRAVEDLSPAKAWIGRCRTHGASFNRTVPHWKTDEDFTPDSTEDERWLDTLLQVLRFERTGGKKDLIWYHFSAHPVCFADTLAGPDWPGMVAEKIEEKEGISPSFLQGHAGDVNPGDGKPWRGDAEKTTNRVTEALVKALDELEEVETQQLASVQASFDLPLDLRLFRSQIRQYEENPDKCSKGPWVDPGFAKAWYEQAKTWDEKQTVLSAPLSAVRMGEVGFVFHPSELFSFYGLRIRHESPFDHTWVVGYTDGSVGYLTDPTAYEKGEYAAIVVPKILGLPPFTRTAAREMTGRAIGLLREALG